MSGYSVSSAAATQLPQFAPANNSTNESGATAQKAAVTAPTPTLPPTRLSRRVFHRCPRSKRATPTTTTATSMTCPIRQRRPAANPSLRPSTPFRAPASASALPTTWSSSYPASSGPRTIWVSSPSPWPPPLPSRPRAQQHHDESRRGLGGGLGNVTATLSHAGSIGPMSVPASWAAPTSTHISPLEPAGFTTLPGTEEPVASGYPGYPGMPGGGASRSVGAGVPPRYGVRLTVMPRPPAAG